MDNKLLKFIMTNSPDGGFLQSEYWRKFQESVGRKIYNISSINDSGELVAYANIITHNLPIVGQYFYIPRGPVLTQNSKLKTQSHSTKLKTFFSDSINLAKKNNIGWIRIEPNSESDLNLIQENLPDRAKIKKSSVDIQPKEILVLDISKSEEELLAQMKQKTRYNIRLSQKRGVCVSHNMEHEIWSKKYMEEFLRLIRITSQRDKITLHPENYYRQMFKTIPPEILKLYVAEYGGKIIAANIISFFKKTATYMHGASDNVHRDVMAPYLLQWQAIQDAKKAGCERYDFGGVKIWKMEQGTWSKKNWEGITRFKVGFAPETKSIEFPGCQDIVLNPKKYFLYIFLQKAKKIFSKPY